MAVKAGRGYFGPSGDFLSLGHCLVKRDMSNLLVPTLIEIFCFEIPTLCSV
jgi:hypothetical protein